MHAQARGADRRGGGDVTVNRVDENVKEIAEQTTGLRKSIQQDLVATGRTIHQHVAKELQQHNTRQGKGHTP
jgi:hypothetical protein